MKKTTRRAFLVILMIAVLLGAFVQAGCGKAAGDSAASVQMSTTENGMSYVADVNYEDAEMEEAAAEEPMEAELQTAGGAVNTSAGQTQKLILNIYIDMEVEDPSAAMDAIIDYAQSAGGYLLSSEDYYNAEENSGGAYVTVRIPTGSSEAMGDYLASIGEVTSSHANAQDVTTDYYDLQTRIEQGELEIDTLEELLSQCTSVEEVLLVREQLSQVQSDVESMKGQFRVLKELTSYDTIEIYLSPIRSMVNVDDGQRLITGNEFTEGIRQGFDNSVRSMINGGANFVIFLSENILQLVIFAIILIIVVVIIRRIAKKSHARKMQRYEAQKAAYEAKKAEEHPQQQ